MHKLILAAALLAGGCAATLHAHELHVSQAWSRATPPGTTVGVGYLTLHNTGTKTLQLTGASSARAASVEMHETRAGANGLTSMRPIAEVLIPPNGTVRFEPNGRHLMLHGLTKPLVAGERVPVILQIANDRPVELLLEVQPIGALGPAAAAGGHDHHAH